LGLVGSLEGEGAPIFVVCDRCCEITNCFRYDAPFVGASGSAEGQAEGH